METKIDPTHTSPSTTATIMTVTPEMANAWLEKNMSNRTVSKKNVEKIAKDIARGAWQLNGEAIRIGSSGELYDGQHRCLAVAKTGIPIQTVVVFNVEREAQRTMDSGRPRTLNDQLRMDGEKNYTALGATIRLAYGYTNGARTFQSPANASISEYLEWFKDHPEFRDAAAMAQKVSIAGLGIRAGVAGTAYWVLSQIDKGDADEFFRLLLVPAHESGSPILALRESLRKQKEKVKGGQMSPRWVAALLFKAWNRWRDGDNDIQWLRFRPGGASPERFPEPI